MENIEIGDDFLSCDTSHHISGLLQVFSVEQTLRDCLILVHILIKCLEEEVLIKIERNPFRDVREIDGKSQDKKRHLQSNGFLICD